MNELTDTAEQTAEDDVLDEIADIEEYARKGHRPPLCRGYRVKVNGKPFVVHEPAPKGREVLVTAGLTPPDDFTLRVKIAGERPRKVGLDERIDLRARGVEKFKALPRDQTEG